jgi:hypothetical protein
VAVGALWQCGRLRIRSAYSIVHHERVLATSSADAASLGGLCRRCAGFGFTTGLGSEVTRCTIPVLDGCRCTCNTAQCIC